MPIHKVIIKYNVRSVELYLEIRQFNNILNLLKKLSKSNIQMP